MGFQSYHTPNLVVKYRFLGTLKVSYFRHRFPTRNYATLMPNYATFSNSYHSVLFLGMNYKLTNFTIWATHFGIGECLDFPIIGWEIGFPGIRHVEGHATMKVAQYLRHFGLLPQVIHQRIWCDVPGLDGRFLKVGGPIGKRPWFGKVTATHCICTILKC